MESTAYLGGKWVPLHGAKVSALDRGFLFGDGVYEVIPVYHGIPFHAQEHLDRLYQSFASIDLLFPHPKAWWQTLIQELLERNSGLGPHQKIYIQVTRGTEATRSHNFPESVSPTVFLFTAPLTLPTIDSLAVGKKAITAEDIRWARCDIKSISLLGGILANHAAQQAGAEEAILLHEGYVTEGASSNVFIVYENEILTPPLSHRILGGITRNLILELAKAHGSISESPISEAMLHQAQEIWISSSTRMVAPVVELDGYPVGTGQAGPIWKKIVSLYLEALNSQP